VGGWVVGERRGGGEVVRERGEEILPTFVGSSGRKPLAFLRSTVDLAAASRAIALCFGLSRLDQAVVLVALSFVKGKWSLSHSSKKPSLKN
jgi:hypothetical protein